MGLSKDWRKQKRIESGFLIKYQTSKEATDKQTANLKDISTGGLKFVTNEEVNQGDIIHLDVLIPDYEKPISAEAEVLRVNPVQVKGGHTVAVEFKSISQEDKDALDKFIRDLIKDSKIPSFIDLPEFVLRRKKS